MQFLIFLSKERQIHICLLYIICAITYWKKVSSVAWLWVSLWVRNWKWNNLIFCRRRRNTKSSWSVISNKRIYSEIIISILRTSAKELSPLFDLLEFFKEEKQLFIQAVLFVPVLSVCFFPVSLCRAASLCKNNDASILHEKTKG